MTLFDELGGDYKTEKWLLRISTKLCAHVISYKRSEVERKKSLMVFRLRRFLAGLGAHRDSIRDLGVKL
jgi:hypothetical protein